MTTDAINIEIKPSSVNTEEKPHSTDPTPLQQPKSNPLMIFTMDSPNSLKFPCKTILLAVVLSAIGIGLLGGGLSILAGNSENKGNAAPFIVIGFICVIPGFWHFYKYLKFKRAGDEEKKRAILCNIC